MKDPAKNKLKNKSGGPERDIKNVPGQAEKSGVFSSLLKKEGASGFPRFLDITEYSTNAIIIPLRSYRHPALRESA